MLVVAACAHPAPRPTMFAQAEAYEQFMGRWSRLIDEPLVTFAGVSSGQAVLDVGSGTGELAVAVRDRGGVVTGIDLSPDFVSYAKQHAPGITFAVGDAQKLAFAPATFDVSLSLLVLNFVPDPATAVREMARVTKPGGTIAAAVWDYSGDMEMLRIFFEEATALDPSAKDERATPLGKPGALAQLFRSNGFDHVEEAPLVVELRFASFDDYWKPFLLGTGPAGAYMKTLSADRREALAARLRRRLGDGAFTLKARAWAVKALAPAELRQ
ncbi:MAG: class I SAM-dependent methyltransferase [Kofleriaceae bacterium]